MIAPVTFAGLPRDLVKPINDTVGLLPPEGAPYNVDQWDGYTDDRREVFEHLRDNGVTDSLFITGDIHSGWACDLPADKATYAGARNSVGVEFVASSVTSNNLKDITGTPRRTTQCRRRGDPQGEQPPHQVPQLRRPRVLGPRHHREASSDGLVHHRRPRRQGDGCPLDEVVRHHGRQPGRPPRLRTGGFLMAGVPATPPDRPQGGRCLRCRDGVLDDGGGRSGERGDRAQARLRARRGRVPAGRDRRDGQPEGAPRRRARGTRPRARCR